MGGGWRPPPPVQFSASRAAVLVSTATGSEDSGRGGLLGSACHQKVFFFLFPVWRDGTPPPRPPLSRLRGQVARTVAGGERWGGA